MKLSILLAIISILCIISLNAESERKERKRIRGWSKKKESFSSSDIRPKPECPAGLISMWFGDLKDIPEGFRLCDGKEGTPDLRGRFPLGASKDYPFGSYGGNFKIKLDSKQLPPHKHGISDDYIDVTPDGAHRHNAEGFIKKDGDHKHGAGDLWAKKDGEHKHGVKLKAEKGGHWHKEIDLKTEKAGLHSHGIFTLYMFLKIQITHFFFFFCTRKLKQK